MGADARRLGIAAVSVSRPRALGVMARRKARACTAESLLSGAAPRPNSLRERGQRVFDVVANITFGAVAIGCFVFFLQCSANTWAQFLGEPQHQQLVAATGER